MRGLVRMGGSGDATVTEFGMNVLCERGDGLAGCMEGSVEAAELVRIADMLDARSLR